LRAASVEISRCSVYLSTRLVAGGGAGVGETAVGCVDATDGAGCVDVGLLQLTSAASTSTTAPAVALIGIPLLAGLGSITRAAKIAAQVIHAACRTAGCGTRVVIELRWLREES
jgi:hypothetical protein